MAIRTIGVGGDFSTPVAWEASLPAVLTEPETARLLDDLSSIAENSRIFDINVTTSATNFITIETWDAVAGEARVQDFKAGNGDIPVIGFTRTGGFGFVTRRTGCDHLVLRNVTVELQSTSSNIILDLRTVPTDNWTEIYDIYFYPQDETLHKGTLQLKNGTKGLIYNNILYSGTSNGIKGASISEVDIYNNTVVSNLVGTSVQATGIRYNLLGTIERNAAFNYGTISGNKCYLNNAPVFNDNASSDTSGNVGFRNLSLLDQYTDPANHDWSFKAGNNLEGAAAGANIGVTVPSIVAGIEGVGNIALSDLALSGQVTLGNNILGVSNVQLNDLTLSGIGTLGNNITGTSNISLDNATLISDGILGNSITGSSSILLSDLTLNANAYVGATEILGSGDYLLSNLILTGQAQLGSNITGNINTNLEALTLVGVSTLGNSISGSALMQLQDVTLTGQGLSGNSISASMSTLLDAITLSGISVLGNSIIGNSNITLDDLLLTGISTLGNSINGVGNLNLDNLTLQGIVSTGAGSTGSMDITLDAVTLQGIVDAFIVELLENDISLVGIFDSDVSFNLRMTLGDFNTNVELKLQDIVASLDLAKDINLEGIL